MTYVPLDHDLNDVFNDLFIKMEVGKWNHITMNQNNQEKKWEFRSSAVRSTDELLGYLMNFYFRQLLFSIEKR